MALNKVQGKGGFRGRRHTPKGELKSALNLSGPIFNRIAPQSFGENFRLLDREAAIEQVQSLQRRG